MSSTKRITRFLLALFASATTLIPLAAAQQAYPGSAADSQPRVTNTSLFDNNDRAAFSQSAYPPPAPAPAPQVAPAPNRNSFSDTSSFARTTVHILPRATQSAQSSFNGGITQAELKLLSNHDVVVVIDKSGSMTSADCPAVMGTSPSALAGMFFGRPGGVSRWDWCRAQALDLARQTSSVFPQGITLVLFASDYKVFTHADIRQVADIFATNRPGGGTNATAAMRAILQDYFKRRDQFPAKIRPLDIAVITDGAPDNARSLVATIVDATRRMRSPDEIVITFLQIGDESEARDLFVKLTDRMQSEGAMYPIVRVKTFDEVVQSGLARSLVQAISR